MALLDRVGNGSDTTRQLGREDGPDHSALSLQINRPIQRQWKCSHHSVRPMNGGNDVLGHHCKSRVDLKSLVEAVRMVNGSELLERLIPCEELSPLDLEGARDLFNHTESDIPSPALNARDIGTVEVGAPG